MDPVYFMLFDEIRHALEEIREHRLVEAKHTLEDLLAVERLIRHYRLRDPHSLRMARVLRYLEWEWTPEGRRELERRIELQRSPEWLREQARLQAMVMEDRIREVAPTAWPER